MNFHFSAPPGNSLLLIHQSITYTYIITTPSHLILLLRGVRRLKMSNKPAPRNIDLTKWRGVTFSNNSLKMDVFLINGASMSMASRPLGPIGKPAIFQNHPNSKASENKQQPQKLKPIQSKRNFSKNRNASVSSSKKGKVSGYFFPLYKTPFWV